MNLIQLFHDLTFYAMYTAAGVAVFVIIERQIFYFVAYRDARLLLAGLKSEEGPAPELIERNSVPAAVVREFLQVRSRAMSQSELEDLSEAIYISNKPLVQARLWILDTVVTAAPLLGLVGTILGIIDTFAVLASSGISDPSGVSKGIGTALYATALGISIALLGLLFYNHLRERADRMSDRIKELLLRAAGMKQQIKAKVTLLG